MNRDTIMSIEEDINTVAKEIVRKNDCQSENTGEVIELLTLKFNLALISAFTGDAVKGGLA